MTLPPRSDLEFQPLYLQHFITARPKLKALVYRLLGSQSATEDLLQDLYLKWHTLPDHDFRSAEAMLVTMATRMAIDKLRRRKIEKQLYSGPWLPEPTQDEEILGPESALQRRQTVSLAFLHLAEGLSRLQRAVFVLKEAFDYPHEEIAKILDIKSSYSRQLLRRAKQILPDLSAFTPVSESHPLLLHFLNASEQGEMGAFLQALSDDVVAIADGGGKQTAFLIPLVGKKLVTTVFSHIAQKQKLAGLRYELKPVNGSLGLWIFNGSVLETISVMQVDNHQIITILTQRNPDKLAGMQNLKQNT